MKNAWGTVCGAAAIALAATTLPAAEAASTNSPTSSNSVISDISTTTATEAKTQNWNFHVQNTGIIQADPGFHAAYAGPNSLNSKGEIKETISLDLMAGARLWRGAEAHVDTLAWQGFGLSQTRGVDAFPNGEAYRVGTHPPNVNIARLFIRQTFGLGGEQENVDDDQFQLAGKQDISRVTLTVGKFSVIDIFDDNSYAHDPRTQFLNWAFIANEAWDYPADSLGYTTGMAVELNQSAWAVRYGFFQMPKESNGVAQDQNYLKAWGMVTELEYRYHLGSHPGAARVLLYLNQAHMGSYGEALSVPGIDITKTRAYRRKYGIALNLEQEIVKDIGAFYRIGWSDGNNEAWAYSDVDRAASLGISVKGEPWHRPDDTFAMAGVVNAISRVHQEFFEAGGVGVLAGDGALNYGWEKVMETYYDFAIWKTLHGAADYQFVANPAFNRDRGPVSIIGGRLHWEF